LRVLIMCTSLVAQTHPTSPADRVTRPHHITPLLPEPAKAGLPAREPGAPCPPLST
jgi:hypothetical protein